MRHIDTADGARALAFEILSKRTKPLLLVSTDAEGMFQFDLERIEREVAGDVDVVTITHGAVTFALGDGLPDKANLHSGAARSYPTDFGEDPDWRRSILRFPDRHTDEELIEDALAQAVFVPVAEPVRSEWIAAVVERVSGSTGNIAKLANGDLVRIVADRLPPTLSLSDALVVGESVQGWLRDLDLAPEPAAVDYSGFVDGSTTLARVIKVTAARVTLTLQPADVDGIPLRRRDVVPGADNGENSDVQVANLVRVGQTVRARVVRTRAAKTVGLSLVDVDEDAQLAPSLSLLKGGAPWLREGVDAAPLVHSTGTESHAVEPDPGNPRVPTGVPAPAAATPPAQPAADSASTTAALTEIRDELAELRGAFTRLGREVRSGTDLETLDRLRDESAGLSAELQRERSLRREKDTVIAGLRVELRDARSRRAPSEDDQRVPREMWPSDEEWLRFEVLTAWAARTIASEKSTYPLGEYVIGPDFMQSVLALDDGQRDKTFRAIVDVVTGRAAAVTGRQLHRLREGMGGNAPYVVRADGAACWRSAIEVNVPSARRLHHWQLLTGEIELSRVAVHDDFQP